eukprot:Partr_v1_DN28019_c2_g1_i4_m57530 putative Glycerol kinase
MKQLIGSLDQGTTSTRFIIFSVPEWRIVSQHQVESKSIVSQAGWCEQEPLEIYKAAVECIQMACSKLPPDSPRLSAIGITNQRESTVAWDKSTGLPLSNALIWMDTRTRSIVDRLRGESEWTRKVTGLPISTYFSAVKMRWLVENVSAVQRAGDNLCLGTVDSWLIWKLTGGGSFVTDVTNASRTLLMDIQTCGWSSDMLQLFDIKESWLPRILSSCDKFGAVSVSGPVKGVPVAGVLGDQQASVVGHQCFIPGQAKNTYGTGCFLLFNSGRDPVSSSHGLLTTVAYKLGPDVPTIYALEGAVATAGAGISWLKNNLELLSDVSEVENLAASVPDSAGVLFVPALNGLLAPHWDPNAAGIITGLSHFTKRAHIVRALLEAVSYQSAELLIAMEKDSGVTVQSMRVDGGMTRSDTLVQVQSDIAGIAVTRPSMVETTALGAAFAAALGVGLIKFDSDKSILVSTSDGVPVDAGDVQEFKPRTDENERALGLKYWETAVSKCLTK